MAATTNITISVLMYLVYF